MYLLSCFISLTLHPSLLLAPKFLSHMRPPLSPSSTFSLFLLLFISINLPTSLAVDDDRFTHCVNTFSCGEVSNLKYPFWGGNRAQYCGLPDFQLKCEANIPKIIIRSITYRILDLNSTSQSLTVVREDYLQNLCPSDYKNSTFDPNLFKYGDGVTNVTLLYDCDSYFPKNQYVGEVCKRDDGTLTYVYYVGELFYISYCKTTVLMPVFRSQIVSPDHIPSAIEKGFGLQWMVNDEACDRCAKSGGECGYNETEAQFSCFCREGPQKPSCSQGSSPESTKKLGLPLKIASGVSAGVAALVVLSILFICNRKRCFRIGGRNMLKETQTNHHHNLETFMKDYGGSLGPRQYSYSQVKKMTNKFSEKLGQGGYGVVYKASLPDGRLAAVKVISISKGSGEEFMNEVASISRTSHINIVTLLGFCYEKNKRVLIYEYMPNGSLDKFICKRGSSSAFCTLEWKVLYQIAIGIARGLEYLHRGCNTRILHFDIKPQNILLDEDFCPKISDFGLAKLCQKKESMVSILGTRGTIGFIAPEMLSRAFGGVSHKSDVYSFGMLVLEMVGGRKNYESGGSHTEEMYFPDWIYKDLEKGSIDSSSCLSLTEEENEVIRKMTFVSLWCIQTNPSDRPAMNKVVEMLEGALHSLTFPPKPSLNSPTRSPSQFSNGSSSAILETNSTNT